MARNVLGNSVNEKSYVCQLRGRPDDWYMRIGSSGAVNTRIALADLNRAVIVEESQLVATSDIENLMSFNDFKIYRFGVADTQPQLETRIETAKKLAAKARTVRIDEDVWDLLSKHAKPLVDSPNSVLRRLLGLDVEE